MEKRLNNWGVSPLTMSIPSSEPSLAEIHVEQTVTLKKLLPSIDSTSLDLSMMSYYGFMSQDS